MKVSLSAVITLALTVPAFAQDSRRPTGSGSSTGGSAVERGGSSSAGSTSSGSSSSGSSGISSSGGSSGSTASGGNSGTAVRRGSDRPSREPQSSVRRPSRGEAQGGGPAIPTYSRPRDGRVVQGEAVARGDNALPSRGGTYYYEPYYGGYYGYNGYYGSRYGYGYGYLPIYTGFGYFYYDPYWGGYDSYYSRGYYGAGSGYQKRDDRDYDIGSLRLKVDPAQGEVFVDGLYRGMVDEFDGVFQRLKLEAGAHRVEIRAPGFRTLAFDVLVTPGETTTYRGNLRRQ
ncbi:MAG: hypothetical protein M3R55_06535 [Acidobacteriota bacterium]|nr:hypothetical protein [Acidobacteriota bacterium]